MQIIFFSGQNKICGAQKEIGANLPRTSPRLQAYSHVVSPRAEWDASDAAFAPRGELWKPPFKANACFSVEYEERQATCTFPEEFVHSPAARWDTQNDRPGPTASPLCWLPSLLCGRIFVDRSDPWRTAHLRLVRSWRFKKKRNSEIGCVEGRARSSVMVWFGFRNFYFTWA